MTYTEPDLAELRATMATCARPRYAAMTDPHDNNDLPGEPAIRVISYMGDYDTYYETRLVGPYPDEQSRNSDLSRFRHLPLGAPEYRGGYEFLASTTGAAAADPEAELVPPEQMTRAGTVEEFFDALSGRGPCGEGTDDGSGPHPDQMSFFA